MSFVLALDQGTTSSRAILFDRGGNVHAAVVRNSSRYFLSPPGSSTTRMRYGRPKLALRRKQFLTPAFELRTSPASASPTSVRPRWSGIESLANQSPMPSSGRTGARLPFVTGSKRTDANPSSERRRVWSSMLISRGASSTGCWKTFRVRGKRLKLGISLLERSIPGWSGNSPAAPATSPIPATRRGRCCSISIPATGMRNY